MTLPTVFLISSNSRQFIIQLCFFVILRFLSCVDVHPIFSIAEFHIWKNKGGRGFRPPFRLYDGKK